MKVHLPNLVHGNDILFTMDWILEYPSGVLKFGRAHYDPKDLGAVVQYIDGVGFMKSMVTFFEQRRILNYQGPHLGSSYTASDGKRMYVKFQMRLCSKKVTILFMKPTPSMYCTTAPRSFGS